MTHKSGHVIVKSLLSIPDLTPAQRRTLEDLEDRDTYDRMDRMYLAWLTYRLLGT
jgi:hypothetical protein